MSKKMLINATHLEENRVAIVEDGVLSELDIEIAGKEQTKGNIYKAVVVRVETGLQAAFVDYGGERLGFLQMGEIHPNYLKDYEKNGENKGRPRIADVLRRGQELLVQIVKEERGTKGAALTTFLSLPGRYMVLMPDSTTKGISRKIEDESSRKQLKAAMGSLDLPGDMGYIVRTAGIGQTTEELKRDFDYLVRLYQNIQALARQTSKPALIYKESNLVIRSIRDYFSADMDEVLVDDPKVFEEARDFFKQVMPEYARLVKLHQERRPIFARYQIEEQIETISKNKVPLPSGGSIVIDQTEALVAVDVNSGKMAGEKGVEATAFKSNLEAAAEVGRQLRLRDLGGLIVIDFIDMRDRKHIREVEKALKNALKNDKARVTVGRISQFGLMEMSRQRIKAVLAEGSYLPCPHCQGSGKVKSPEAQAVAFLRKLQAGIAKGQIGSVEGEVPLDVATYLLNTKREELHALEQQRDLAIVIKGHPDLVAGQSELTFHKREREEAEPEYVSAAAMADLPELSPEEAPPAAETEAGEAPSAEGEEKKKRRRRRRRKKGAQAAEAAAAEAAPTEGEAAPEEAAPAAGAPQPAAAEAEAKPKRRTRKKAEPEAPAEAAAPAAEAPQPPPEAAAEAEAKPKRKRARKKAEPEAPAEAAAPAAEAPQPAAEAPQPAAEAAAEAEAKPKRKRTRKKAEPEAPAEAAAPAAAAPQPAPEAAAEAEAKPKRRTRKKAKPEAPPEAAAPAAAAPQPAPEAAAETEVKPKRRTRKKAEPEAPPEAAAPAAAAPQPAPEAAAEAEAKPKRRTRKKAEPKATTESAAPAAEASQPAPEAAAEAEAKPKRRTRKKAEPKAPAE